MRRKVIVRIICMFPKHGSVCMCFGFFSPECFCSPRMWFFNVFRIVHWSKSSKTIHSGIESSTFVVPWCKGGTSCLMMTCLAWSMQVNRLTFRRGCWSARWPTKGRRILGNARAYLCVILRHQANSQSGPEEKINAQKLYSMRYMNMYLSKYFMLCNMTTNINVFNIFGRHCRQQRHWVFLVFLEDTTCHFEQLPIDLPWCV